MDYSWSQFVPFFGVGLVLGLGWHVVLRAFHFIFRTPSIMVGDTF